MVANRGLRNAHKKQTTYMAAMTTHTYYLDNDQCAGYRERYAALFFDLVPQVGAGYGLPEQLPRVYRQSAVKQHHDDKKSVEAGVFKVYGGQLEIEIQQREHDRENDVPDCLAP